MHDGGGADGGLGGCSAAVPSIDLKDIHLDIVAPLASPSREVGCGLPASAMRPKTPPPRRSRRRGGGAADPAGRYILSPVTPPTRSARRGGDYPHRIEGAPCALLDIPHREEAMSTVSPGLSPDQASSAGSVCRKSMAAGRQPSTRELDPLSAAPSNGGNQQETASLCRRGHEPPSSTVCSSGLSSAPGISPLATPPPPPPPAAPSKRLQAGANCGEDDGERPAQRFVRSFCVQSSGQISCVSNETQPPDAGHRCGAEGSGKLTSNESPKSLLTLEGHAAPGNTQELVRSPSRLCQPLVGDNLTKEECGARLVGRELVPDNRPCTPNEIAVVLQAQDPPLPPAPNKGGRPPNCRVFAVASVANDKSAVQVRGDTEQRIGAIQIMRELFGQPNRLSDESCRRSSIRRMLEASLCGPPLSALLSVAFESECSGMVFLFAEEYFGGLFAKHFEMYTNQTHHLAFDLLYRQLVAIPATQMLHHTGRRLLCMQRDAWMHETIELFSITSERVIKRSCRGIRSYFSRSHSARCSATPSKTKTTPKTRAPSACRPNKRRKFSDRLGLLTNYFSGRGKHTTTDVAITDLWLDESDDDADKKARPPRLLPIDLPKAPLVHEPIYLPTLDRRRASVTASKDNKLASVVLLPFS
ncbi:hypothetical protein ERJ75_001525100 [Trypanosoma vivax]|uniref:Uncharacterized protein n=1 Tax=Trypanosoma vivax (strain Y486) TaxID=1055687 RepID=G0UB88_TRYVY|nr:hypothetical protein ERJ75_001525100 [Trypanosoma vivax]CCC53075.1 conserved hypothetical protein [Trypanosoma vivax Y486]